MGAQPRPGYFHVPILFLTNVRQALYQPRGYFLQIIIAKFHKIGNYNRQLLTGTYALRLSSFIQLRHHPVCNGP
jgi:hypothetical protein